MIDSPKVSNSEVIVLDGGFSSQLSLRVGPRVDGDPLWTARFLHTNPGDVMNTHLDYLRAGAHCISTNTYQASVGGFVEYLNMTHEESIGLMVRAVELAKRARDSYVKESGVKYMPLIAGSVGPYGAHLHDGSEYNGGYAESTAGETMREWHIPRIETLIKAGVDVLAFETLPCSKEAEMLVTLLKEYPHMKAWLSFSCKDGTYLANGEEFQSTAKKCLKMNPKQLVAVGVNCCSPVNVEKLFDGFYSDCPELVTPLITYPNSGELYSAQEGWVGGDRCRALHMFVEEWLELGVRYIGSCCRTTAVDIAQIKPQVDAWCKRKQTEVDQQINAEE